MNNKFRREKKRYAIDKCDIALCNGTRFHLRYRTENPENPVLLFLHGGPGSCDRPLVMNYLSALTDTYTIVCWDQRGAGKSFNLKAAKNEEMTLETCVEDVHCVINYLKKRFLQDKIVVVGHSWGSLLGVLTASRYPEDIAAYLGIGQFVNGEENERLSYEFTMNEARRRHDRKALRDLVKIEEPNRGLYKNERDFIIQRNYLQKFGGAFYNTEESIARFVLRAILSTNEYSLLDYVRYLMGRRHCMHQLYSQMIETDFFQSISGLSVPVCFTQGRHDYNTPSVLARRWFEALNAPKKEFIWFEHSAHSPQFEEPQRWMQTVRRVLNHQ